MTVQQCRYILEIERTGSFREAANKLFIAQSSLSSCVKQLEGELGIKIFERSNKGVMLTADGAEFIRYAAQMVEQSEFIEERYRRAEDIRRLHVSTQHYDFITDIFCKLLNETHSEKYIFSLRETKTYDMIRYVERAESDIGILAIREDDCEIMDRFFAKHGITFTPFLTTTPFVFISREHPLASRSVLRIDDVREYPYVYYDQGANNNSFFTEELTDKPIGDKRVEISDRASLMNVLLSSECYTVGTGIMPSRLNDGKIVAIPLEGKKKYKIGYIVNSDRRQSALVQSFIDLLLEFGKEC